MRVKDLMTTSVSCVRPETSLVQVARQMKQENVGAIPVCNDKGEVLGIAGMLGSGRTELLRAIFGADPFDSGAIEIAGKTYRKMERIDCRNDFGGQALN